MLPGPSTRNLLMSDQVCLHVAEEDEGRAFGMAGNDGNVVRDYRPLPTHYLPHAGWGSVCMLVTRAELYRRESEARMYRHLNDLLLTGVHFVNSQQIAEGRSSLGDSKGRGVQPTASLWGRLGPWMCGQAGSPSTTEQISGDGSASLSGHVSPLERFAAHECSLCELAANS
jgi:hypothetical protein